jgi:hypothetical protein
VSIEVEPRGEEVVGYWPGNAIISLGPLSVLIFRLRINGVRSGKQDGD